MRKSSLLVALSLLVVLSGLGSGSLFAQFAITPDLTPASLDTLYYCTDTSEVPTGTVVFSATTAPSLSNYAWSASDGTNDFTGLSTTDSYTFEGYFDDPSDAPLDPGTYYIIVTADDALIPGQVIDSMVLIVNEPVTIAVDAAPDAADTVACEGNIIELVASVDGREEDEWAMFTWSNGQSGPSLDTLEVAAGGSYSVTVMDIYGCSWQSDTQMVVIGTNTLDDIPLEMTTPDTLSFCGGGSASLFANVGEGNLQAGAIEYYEWYRDGILVAEGEDANFYVASEEGDYTFVVRDTFRCEATSDNSLEVEILPTPSKPTFELLDDGRTLLASAAEPGLEYQWFLDGGALSYGTERERLTIQTGVYRVRVTNSGGCTNASDAYFYNGSTLDGPLGVDEALQAGALSVFPNPADAEVTIAYQNPTEVALRLSVVDLTGKQWAAAELPTGAQARSLVLQVQDLPAGLYIVLADGGDRGRVAQRLIIQ